MTYVIGDPNHIPVHNDLLAPIQEQADRFMVDVVLPPIRSVDDTGHTDDHNLIVVALQAIADAPPSGPVWATVASVTGSPTVGTGKDARALRTWTGNGTVTFATAGRVRVCAVGGGCCAMNSGAYSSGGGGEVEDYEFDVEAATYTITVGSGGLWASQTNGGNSSFVLANKLSVRAKGMTAFLLGDGGDATDATGIYTDISGSSVGYGGAGWDDAVNYSAAFGGCPAPGAGDVRANSGGGGGQGGTGNGAAGIVMLLSD